MISLIQPSRGRPTKAIATAKHWIDNAGVDVEWRLSLDYDDETRPHYIKNSMVIEWTLNYMLVGGNNKSVVEATNLAAGTSTGDVLIYLSDDFKCFENWGPAILKEFEGVTNPMLIKVDDCLQPFHVPVLTIPIMNRALYNKLGYFWHPDYKSMFCDEDLYWTARKLGALKMCPHIKFEHQHVSVGKAQDDETYRRSAANWEQGKAVFAKRKAAGFPI